MVLFVFWWGQRVTVRLTVSVQEDVDKINMAASEKESLLDGWRHRHSTKEHSKVRRCARKKLRHRGVGGRTRWVRKGPFRLAVCTPDFVTTHAAPHPKMNDSEPNLAELELLTTPAPSLHVITGSCKCFLVSPLDNHILRQYNWCDMNKQMLTVFLCGHNLKLEKGNKLQYIAEYRNMFKIAIISYRDLSIGIISYRGASGDSHPYYIHIKR